MSLLKVHILLTAQHCLSKLRMKDRETDGQRRPVVLPPGNIKVAQRMGSVNFTFWPQGLFCGLLVRKWGGSLARAIIQAQGEAKENWPPGQWAGS